MIEFPALVYVQRGGVGPPLADNYAGPYLVLEKGLKVFKLQLGTREEVVSRDRDHVGMAPPATQGAPTPEWRVDLPQHFARSPASSVTEI